MATVRLRQRQPDLAYLHTSHRGLYTYITQS